MARTAWATLCPSTARATMSRSQPRAPLQGLTEITISAWVKRARARLAIAASSSVGRRGLHLPRLSLGSGPRSTSSSARRPPKAQLPPSNRLGARRRHGQDQGLRIYLDGSKRRLHGGAYIPHRSAHWVLGCSTIGHQRSTSSRAGCAMSASTHARSRTAPPGALPRGARPSVEQARLRHLSRNAGDGVQRPAGAAPHLQPGGHGCRAAR